MKRLIIFLIMLYILGLSSISLADENEDGLEYLLKSDFFTLNAYSGFDVYGFLDKIRFDYFTDPSSIFTAKGDSVYDILGQTLDAIYMEVSSILDIHMYTFDANISIVRDKNDLNYIYKKIFNLDAQERSFYLVDNNTLYLSYDDITLGVLAHEMSHAIISKYFVVPPSVVVQEVLCGYVEYKLMKSKAADPKQ